MKLKQNSRCSISEHDEQAALFYYLAHHPDLWVVFAIPNGGVRNKVTAAKLKREGVTAGVWDIFVPIPAAAFHGLFIEMKFGKNKLTQSQIKFGKQMVENGYKCLVCYNAIEAYNAIVKYLDIASKFEF